jgi:hypothetical protein
MPGFWIVVPRHAAGWPGHYSLDSSATSGVANACSAHHAARELRLTSPLRGQAGAEMSDQCGQRSSPKHPACGRKGVRVEGESEFSISLGKVVRRELGVSGIPRFDRLTSFAESDLLQIHGVSARSPYGSSQKSWKRAGWASRHSRAGSRIRSRHGT